MQSFPKTGRNKKRVKSVMPESDLQSFADEFYELKRHRTIRVPDAIFRWINAFAPIDKKIFFNKTFGGLPDNLVLIQAGKYCIAVPIELKTKSELHGKQKFNAKDENWIICRTPEEVRDAIYNAEKDALFIQQCFEGRERRNGSEEKVQ